MNDQIYKTGDDSIRNSFFRQRRNLMAISLVLLVADLPDKLHTTIADLTVHTPFTISMVLWIVWGYWLYRYYVYFRDIGEKGFSDKQGTRMMVLVERWAKRKFDNDSTWRDERIKNVLEMLNKSDPNSSKRITTDLQSPHEWKIGKYPETCPLGVWNFHGIPVQVTLKLFVERVSKERMIQHQGHDQVTIEGLEAMKLNSRAFMHVLIHTRIFSEYYLPFLIALTPVAYFVYWG